MVSEKRLIDANALIAEYDRVHIGPPGGARKLMEEAPTVDAVEVVHGRWIYHADDLFPADSTMECSVCHEHEYLTLLNNNYCPHCGAKMDGGNEDGNL